MTADHEKLKAEFFAAFAAANPDSKDIPTLTYENGWWRFSYGTGWGRPQGVRRQKLQEMTARLWARVDKLEKV